MEYRLTGVAQYPLYVGFGRRRWRRIDQRCGLYSNAVIHPGATEVCGGGDEDCDGLIDDADPSVSGQSLF